MRIRSLVLGVVLCGLTVPIIGSQNWLKQEEVKHPENESYLTYLGWNSCGAIGLATVILVACGAVFYGFDRLISDGKYTRNVVREAAKMLMGKLEAMGIDISQLVSSSKRQELEHAALLEGQKKILKEVNANRRTLSSTIIK